MEILIVIKKEDKKEVMKWQCNDDLNDSDAVAFSEIIKSYLLTKISKEDKMEEIKEWLNLVTTQKQKQYI